MFAYVNTDDIANWNARSDVVAVFHAGRPGMNYRRIRVASGHGKTTAMVSDNQTPYP